MLVNALDSPEPRRSKRNAAQVSVGHTTRARLARGPVLRVVRERFHVCHRIHTGYRHAALRPCPLRSISALAPVVARPVDHVRSAVPYRYRVTRPV